MHELSIAGAVLEVVERHARGRRVSAVELRVGHLRQVVPDALTFAWGLVTDGTCATGSELEIEQVPATVRCGSCGTAAELDGFPARCGGCGALDVDVTGGDELLVTALELDDEGALTGTGRA